MKEIDENALENALAGQIPEAPQPQVETPVSQDPPKISHVPGQKNKFTDEERNDFYEKSGATRVGRNLFETAENLESIVEKLSDLVKEEDYLIFYGVGNHGGGPTKGDLDYLLIDCPPGTGDVPLTVFQSLKVDGIIVVTTPQDLVSMIVEKAVKMANLMNVPVLGIVENMSYFECSKCGERHYIFGESGVEKLGIDTVARIPMDPSLANKCDNGEIESVDPEWLNEIMEKIEKI